MIQELVVDFFHYFHFDHYLKIEMMMMMVGEIRDGDYVIIVDDEMMMIVDLHFQLLMMIRCDLQPPHLFLSHIYKFRYMDG